MTSKESGFPIGENIGRIGIDMYTKDGQTVLYALLDNYNRRPEDKSSTKKEELTKDLLRNMDKATFLSLDSKKIETYLENNNFPSNFSISAIIVAIFSFLKINKFKGKFFSSLKLSIICLNFLTIDL